MHFATRVVFHLVVTINSLFKILPLEGRALPNHNMIKFLDATTRYVFRAIKK
jgi:hypothetical protein